MSINQMIAQGLAPIGRDLPEIGNMLMQRRQAETRNALAEQAGTTDRLNAEQYRRSLDMQSQVREQDIAAQRKREARDWLTANYDRIRQQPQMLPQLVQFAKQNGYLDPAVPDDVPLEEIAGMFGVQAPQAPTPYSVNTQPGPYGSSIVTDGKTFRVVPAPQPKAAAAPAAAASAPRTQRLSPDEVKAAGYPAGTVVQRKDDGTEKVVYKPPVESAANAAKLRQQAATQIPRLSALTRRIERVGTAVAAISDNPIFSGGVVSGKVLPYTKEGKELDAAVSQVRPLLTALTRVPGIGSQSDLEARLDGLQYPQADLPAESNQSNVNELNLFIQDLQNAYQSLLQSGSAAPADDGWGIEEVE